MTEKLNKVHVIEYLHVDNGGTTFELVEESPNFFVVKISDSYYGYSESIMKLYHLFTGVSDKTDRIRKVGLFFLKVADYLDSRNKEEL